MKAVVMAGGFGTRLRPLTEKLPKPLAHVANRPMMEHVVRLLAKEGIRDLEVLLYFHALGIPVRDVTLVMALGFQFFPVLLDEGQQVRSALESRGVSLRHPRARLRARALAKYTWEQAGAQIQRIYDRLWAVHSLGNQ